jgi:regulatory protein
MTKEMTAEQAFLRLSALCAQAEHCQEEMLQKMRQWGMDEEAQASVMARLVNERYVDDERYCRAFVSDKIKYNKWGRRKIEQALWLKHIDEETSRRVLDEIDDGDYVAILRPLWQQKQQSVRAASDYELRMKMMKWALGRGFSMDVIRQCMDSDDDECEFTDEDF